MTIEDVPELRKYLHKLLDVIDAVDDNTALGLFRMPWTFDVSSPLVTLSEHLRYQRAYKGYIIADIDGPLKPVPPRETEAV